MIIIKIMEELNNLVYLCGFIYHLNRHDSNSHFSKQNIYLSVWNY
ncbi:MAG TPA: hypothetical protein PKH93_02960 [Chitinophagales bacterium]|nr:hypothetical protein [Chitinophagales bacterium]